MRIAVIAHDGKKADMVSFVMKRLDFFKKNEGAWKPATPSSHPH